MKCLLITISLLISLTFFSGCASWRNSIARDGSMFTSTRGPYIVMSYSGGVITDVWVLDDAYVESESDSDGWLFIDIDIDIDNDNDNRPINVGGDAKVIRIKDKRDLKNYREFHVEIDGGIYLSPMANPVCKLPGDNKVAGRYHLRKRTKRIFGRIA